MITDPHWSGLIAVLNVRAFPELEPGAAAQERQQTIIQESEKHLDAEPWPQAGLLSIGTFGNEEPPPATAQEQEQDLPEFTVEEVKKLQDALAMLLRRAKSKSSARGSAAGEDRPPLDRFLNCPSCLEVDRSVQTTTKHGECDGHEGEGDLSPDTKIILTRARDLLDSGSGGGSIKQRSFKFLLKKMFACNGGFSAAPPRGLKDPVESRMEKVCIRVRMIGRHNTTKLAASCNHV